MRFYFSATESSQPSVPFLHNGTAYILAQLEVNERISALSMSIWTSKPGKVTISNVQVYNPHILIGGVFDAGPRWSEVNVTQGADPTDPHFVLNNFSAVEVNGGLTQAEFQFDPTYSASSNSVVVASFGISSCTALWLTPGKIGIGVGAAGGEVGLGSDYAPNNLRAPSGDYDVAPCPEPTSLALLGLGALALSRRRKA